MTREPDRLRTLVAELFQVPEAEVGPAFSLRHPRFQSSSARGILAAAIRRRLGVFVPQAFSAATYGELVAATFGGNGSSGEETGSAKVPVAPSPEAGRPAPILPGAVEGGVAVGIDMEMVDGLPEASDFWTSEYYRSHFTLAEIAYCVRQENPRMHFAARWCAKEALAKCDARFVALDPATVQVALDAGGRPVFEQVVEGGQLQRLPHALSLTHTPLFAAAVVAAGAQRG